MASAAIKAIGMGVIIGMVATSLTTKAARYERLLKFSRRYVLLHYAKGFFRRIQRELNIFWRMGTRHKSGFKRGRG